MEPDDEPGPSSDEGGHGRPRGGHEDVHEYDEEEDDVTVGHDADALKSASFSEYPSTMGAEAAARDNKLLNPHPKVRSTCFHVSLPCTRSK